MAGDAGRGGAAAWVALLGAGGSSAGSRGPAGGGDSTSGACRGGVGTAAVVGAGGAGRRGRLAPAWLRRARWRGARSPRPPPPGIARGPCTHLGI